MIVGSWGGWALDPTGPAFVLEAEGLSWTVPVSSVISPPTITETVFGAVADPRRAEHLVALLVAIDDVFDPLGHLEFCYGDTRIAQGTIRRLVARAVNKGCPVATDPEAQS